MWGKEGVVEFGRGDGTVEAGFASAGTVGYRAVREADRDLTGGEGG